MSAFVAVQIDIQDRATYARYIELAPASIIAYGGRYIARGGKVETLEGDWHPARFVLLEFPTFERAKAWWASPEYAEAKRLRQASASAEMIVVEGLDTPIG